MSTAVIPTLREIALRSWRKTLRRPVPLSFSFVQPLLWMLIFGFLFQRFTLGSEYHGIAYLDFLLPGICCMTVLFGASQSGINLVRDLQTGFVQRMVRASARPGFLLAGMIGADVIRLLAQALIVALIGVAVGGHLSINFGALVIAVAGVALFAFAYASLSCSIALATRAQESMAVFVHIVNMPLLFTSTALVPSRQMPGWLSTIAEWNPLSLVAGALRDALLFDRTPAVASLFIPLLVLTASLFIVARYTMTRAASD